MFDKLIKYLVNKCEKGIRTSFGCSIAAWVSRNNRYKRRQQNICDVPIVSRTTQKFEDLYKY